MNNTPYSGAASIKSEYDLMISYEICKWLQEKYDLKPSESMDIWSQVCASIENMVQIIYRNDIWDDMMGNSNGYLYATTDSGETRLLGKIDEKIIEKINEIEEGRGDNDE